MKAFGKSGIRKMTVVLAAFVALLTAYVLTLPAITVTQDAARPEAGFYIDGQQNTADLGREAAARLIELIEHPKTALIDRYVVSGHLLEGGSVADLSNR